jgi:hypothetical protein
MATPTPQELTDALATIKDLQTNVANLGTALWTANSKINDLTTQLNGINATAANTPSAVVAATPAAPIKQTSPDAIIYTSVKIATSNLFINTTPEFSGGIPYLFFEDLSTAELANTLPQYSLSNNNFPSNDIISNIKSTLDRFSSYNLSKIPNLADYVGFQLSRYVPSVGNGTGGSFVYFDSKDEYIVIETVNINNKELVQYEVLSQSKVLDATI